MKIDQNFASTAVRPQRPTLPIGHRRLTLGKLAGVLVIMLIIAVGGWRYMKVRLGGSFFPSRVPADAASLSAEERVQQTKRRMTEIRAALLKFRDRTGHLPATLEELVPQDLREIPESLISTKPIWFSTREELPRICTESWPDASYEHYWLDIDGQFGSDM